MKLAKTLWHSCMTIYPGWFKKQTHTSQYGIGHFFPQIFFPKFHFQAFDKSQTFDKSQAFGKKTDYG
jgi:hypothetical protein